MKSKKGDKMIEAFENKMPYDEAIHAKKCQFQYEVCEYICPYKATEKCMGIVVCMEREGFV
jgi:hypothetical protein